MSSTFRLPLCRSAFLLVCLLCLHGRAADRPAPRVFILDAALLARSTARLGQDDPTAKAALRPLLDQADKALTAGPFSVTAKKMLPPSGDRHDYMSIGPYWWPDPAKSDGRPYVRRDGEVNPERHTVGDADSLKQMQQAVRALALAWHFTGRDDYARRAALLLRTWFLDEATRMNPHLSYAQAVPGRCEGRGIGIVDTAGMIHVVDAIGLLGGSPHWTPADQAGMERWFERFLAWLTDSKMGKEESRTANNHATQYDAQVAAYALLTGKTDLARQVLQAVPRRRIDTQIQPDGRQPHELARTKSWGYSTANLGNFFHLARLGEHVGVDLWTYRSADGRSIRAALDYLLPYARGRQPWPHKEIGTFAPERLLPMLRQSVRKYPGAGYDQAVEEIAKKTPDDLSVLLTPGP